MKHTAIALVPCLLSLSVGVRAASLADIHPGEWFEAPGSKLETVAPAKIPEGSWNGFKAVMESWSGAGFDSKRERLIVWGGGHHDYSGNELYAYDVNKLAWSRLNESSTDFGGDEKTGEYPDGNPRSRHTYNYIQYVPAIDRFCTLGGHGQFPSGQVGTSTTHCFDFETSKWERKNAGAVGSIGAISGVDETTGKVYLHSSGGGRLLEWNPTADAWTPRATYAKGWFDYYYTGAVGDGKFIAIGLDGKGKATLIKWDLANPGAAAVIMDIPASVEAAQKPNPGFTWDSKRKVFVAWSGGAKLWVLNPATMGWDAVAIATTNKVTPTASEKLGTYGRFRYVPSKDVFMGVNRTSESVWFFRMPTNLPLKINKGSGMVPGTLNLEIAAGRAQVTSREFPLAQALVSGESVQVRLWDLQSRLVWHESRAFVSGSRNRILLPEAGAMPGHFLELDQGGRSLLRLGL